MGEITGDVSCRGSSGGVIGVDNDFEECSFTCFRFFSTSTNVTLEADEVLFRGEGDFVVVLGSTMDVIF